MCEKISKIPNQKEQQRKYCRICLEESQPLTKLPCNCKGSLSYIHNSCLNKMLKVKQELKKEDVQDYIQIFSDKFIGQYITIKCQICLREILLQKEEALSWQKLMNVQFQVYLVLFGISGISVFGLNIAVGLLEKAFYETGLVSKSMYLAAYVWIIGVIFYVIFQPIYSEIKVVNYEIPDKKTKKNKGHMNLRQKLKMYLLPVELNKKDNERGRKMLNELKSNQNRMKSSQAKIRSNSKQRIKINRWQIQTQPKYYQI